MSLVSLFTLVRQLEDIEAAAVQKFANLILLVDPSVGIEDAAVTVFEFTQHIRAVAARARQVTRDHSDMPFEATDGVADPATQLLEIAALGQSTHSRLMRVLLQYPQTSAGEDLAVTEDGIFFNSDTASASARHTTHSSVPGDFDFDSDSDTDTDTNHTT
jgi:hypothetical protein